MSNPRTYIIRGLNLDVAGAFNCQGELANLPGFTVIDDVPTQAKAIELLLTGGIAKMVAIPPVKSESYIDVLNVKAEIFVTSTGEAKKIRKQLAKSIETWAEKSRVRGVRGWRAHALKTPKIQKQVNGNGYELDFDAIFGHAVFYNEKVMSVGNTDNAAFIGDTIADLKKHLQRLHPGLIGEVSAVHEAKQLSVTA